MTLHRFAWIMGWICSIALIVPGLYNTLVGITTLDGSQGWAGAMAFVLGAIGGGGMVAWTADKGIPPVNMGLPRKLLKEQREADRQSIVEHELERRRIEREARNARLERDLETHRQSLLEHERWMSSHALEAGPATEEPQEEIKARPYPSASEKMRDADVPVTPAKIQMKREKTAVWDERRGTWV